jgi:SNF2 family DNA or RNA helicase
MSTAGYIINKKKTMLAGVQLSEPHPVTLLPHQQETVDRAPKKRLLAFDTGTGKTITAISLCNRHHCSNVLVIAPKTNVEQWGIELVKYLNKDTGFTVISKEEFKAQVKTLQPYPAVIVDEGHYFAGISSALSKALNWYLNKHKTEYVYIATATPYCSTPLNIYTLAKHLGYAWNYQAFKEKFFYYIPMGARSVPVPRPGMEDEVARLVKMIGDTVDMKEVAILKEGKMPEQKEEVIDIPLTSKQLKAIDDIFDPVFLVRWTKQHQIENGFLYGEGSDEVTTFSCDKTLAVMRLCQQHDKIVVVARYTHQLELYKKLLEERDIEVFLLSGVTKDRQDVIDGANKSKRCVFLMQASCSAGFELPTFRVMVFASLSFSHVDHLQAKGRILRINNLKENTYLYLVAEGVDQDVYECIMKKQDFNIAIYKKD